MAIPASMRLPMSDTGLPEFQPTAFDSSNPFQAPQALEADAGGYVTRADAELNPWISTWTKPRATIRQIVDTNPTYLVLPLAMLAGVAQFLQRLTSPIAANAIPFVAILIAAAVIGPLGGIIGLYLVSALLRWTGSWLGGVATSQEVRAAYAWGQIPRICSLAILIPALFWFNRTITTGDFDDVGSTTVFQVALALSLLATVLGIWQAVLMVKCLAEVHRFSAWRSIGAYLLSGLIVFGVVIVPMIMLIAVGAAFSR